MSTLYRATVTRIDSEGVFVKAPDLGEDGEWGPLELLAIHLEVDDPVIVGSINDIPEDLALLGKLVLEPEDTPYVPGPNERIVYYFEDETIRDAYVINWRSGDMTWLDNQQRLDIYTDEGTPGWVWYFGIKNNRLLLPQPTRIGVGSTGPLAALDFAATTTTDRLVGVGVSGDSVGRFIILATGQHEWGSGAGGRDTNLYRSTADTLKTDDAFIVQGNLTGNSGFTLVGSATVMTNLKVDGYASIGVVTDSFSKLKILNTINASRGITVVSTAAAQSDGHLQMESAAGNANAPAIGALLTGDTQNRFGIMMNGTHVWGAGNAPQDTNLYRSAADTLKTDDSFVVGGTSLEVTNTLTVGGVDMGRGSWNYISAITPSANITTTTETIVLTFPSATYKANRAYRVIHEGRIQLVTAGTNHSGIPVIRVHKTNVAGQIVVDFGREPLVNVAAIYPAARSDVFVVGASDVTATLVVTLQTANSGTTQSVVNHYADAANGGRSVEIVDIGPAARYTNKLTLA